MVTGGNSGIGLATALQFVKEGAYVFIDANIATSSVVYGMKILAQNVQGIIVPNSGHWIAEEQPGFLVKLLNHFFSGNPIETSK